MKKLFILLLSLGLLMACKNDKNKAKQNTESQSKDEDTKKSEDGDKGSIDRNSGQNDDVVDDDEEGNHVADGANWTSRDINDFTVECEKAAIKNGVSKNEAQTYCNCMLRKLTTKYPDINDAAKLDREGPELEAMASDCRAAATQNSSSSGSEGWSRKQELDFVNDCVREAQKAGMKDELDAQSYCDCMQYKIEKLYPNYADANRITKADQKKPSMKKMIEDCLPGN